MVFGHVNGLIGDGADEIFIMCSDEKKPVRCFQPVDEIGDPNLSVFVEAAQRFVHDQDGGLHGEDCGEGGPLFFAAAQVERGAAAERFQPQKSNVLLDARGDFFVRQSHLVQTEGDLILHAACEKLHFRVLQDKADAAVERCGERFVAQPLFSDLLSLQQILPRGRKGQAVQDAEER